MIEDDPRTEEERSKHSQLAAAILAAEDERRQSAPDAAEHAEEMAALIKPYPYEVGIAYTGAFYTNIEIGFFIKTPDEPQKKVGHFIGRGASAGIGVGWSWGSAWLHYRIEEVIGWYAGFLFKFEPLASGGVWWGMKGEFIGGFAAGGVGSGIFGPSGGIGEFRKPFP